MLARYVLARTITAVTPGVFAPDIPPTEAEPASSQVVEMKGTVGRGCGLVPSGGHAIAYEALDVGGKSLPMTRIAFRTWHRAQFGGWVAVAEQLDAEPNQGYPSPTVGDAFVQLVVGDSTNLADVSTIRIYLEERPAAIVL